MFHATVIGRVVRAPEQFGKVIKFTVVHNPGQKSGYESRFVDVLVMADKWPAQDVLKLQKGDNVTVLGEVEREPWKKDPTKFNEVMKFARVEVPWDVRSRDAAGEVKPAAAAGAPPDEDPFEDPFA
jgi:hypothetical protein